MGERSTGLQKVAIIAPPGASVAFNQFSAGAGARVGATGYQGTATKATKESSLKYRSAAKLSTNGYQYY